VIKIFKIIRKLFDNGMIDFRLERYLADSSDIVDLEFRQKRWTYIRYGEE
jgi:hypothetical protein